MCRYRYLLGMEPLLSPWNWKRKMELQISSCAIILRVIHIISNSGKTYPNFFGVCSVSHSHSLPLRWWRCMCVYMIHWARGMWQPHFPYTQWTTYAGPVYIHRVYFLGSKKIPGEKSGRDTLHVPNQNNVFHIEARSKVFRQCECGDFSFRVPAKHGQNEQVKVEAYPFVLSSNALLC